MIDDQNTGHAVTDNESDRRRRFLSDVALRLQGFARCLSYSDDGPLKHTLLEASHALDSHAIRVHKKRGGLLIVNARGRSRYMSWRERLAHWLLNGRTEIRP